MSAPFPQTFAWGTATIGDEIYGVAGPSPVNCISPTYRSARTDLDAQRAAWETTAIAALPGAVALHSTIPGPTGSTVDASLVLQQPDGFSITITPIDLLPSLGYASTSNANGVPSFADVQINGSSSGCTMQDYSPKPSANMAGDYYFNQINNLRGLNGVRFGFSTPVQAFGIFVGDLETSLRGTTAFMRLLDANGALIEDVAIPSSLGLSGGVAAENAQCDTSNVPDANVTSQGLAPGCGNGSTRWVGFVSTTPVAQALIVVGDNDPLPNGLGLSEKLSVMGLTVVRVLPAAEVTIAKSAPAQVTVGEPFNYTLVISNTSTNLAGGIVLTDVAPAGVSFVAVAGSGCSLSAGTVSCSIESLPAHTATTVLIRAVAAVTTTVTNLAQISAINDIDTGNNQATAAVTALAALPVNYCAPAVSNPGQSLVINEVLYNEVGSTGDEWVEIYVSNALSGGALYFLSDDEVTGTGFNRVITVPVGGIPAGTYLVIHDDVGVDDLDPADGLVQLWSAGNGGVSGTTLRNTGDNITLYAGNSALAANAIDYMRFFTSTTDATNDPPPPSLLWSGFASGGAIDGQSVARMVNGVDGSSGSDWVLAGTNGTVGTASLGANNNGLTVCNVAISKSGPTTGIIGVPFDYTLTVRNTTQVTLSQVIVSDTQPAGLIFNSVSGTGCNLANGLVTCAVGSLLPAASQTILINATATAAQIITNTAYSNALSDTLSADNQATQTITIQAFGSIGDFVYLDPNQDGLQQTDETTAINGVLVTLTLPDGSQRSTITEDGLYHFANLPAGLYTVTVGSAPGYLRTSSESYVVLLGVAQDYVQADFGFNSQVAALSLSKQGIPSVALGASFPYTLQVSNLSNQVSALDVIITDTPPSGIYFTSVVDGRCAIVVGQLICNLGRLAPLASESIILQATAQSAGDWSNRAFVVASNSNTTSATFSTTILTPSAALQIQKSILQPITGAVKAGEALVYVIHIENHGTTTATTFSLLDRYPSAQLQFNRASITPTVQSSGLLTWTLGPDPALLAAGEALTITVAFTVTK